MIKEIDILKQVIADMPHGITVSSIVNNGGESWTLNVDHTYYLTISRKVTIESLDYKVTAFELNESITINPIGHTTAPTTTTFEIPSPTFRHGTAKMVNIEHTKTDYRTSNKYPFIWLVETFDTNHIGDINSRIGAVMPLNLLFFTDNDKENWLIEDHYTNAIYPMHNEIDYFISVLKSKRSLFNDEFDYTTTNHVNFGEYLLNKGAEKNIISDNLSGVQARLDLEFFKNKCKR